jgi:hypothetical protein
VSATIHRRAFKFDRNFCQDRLPPSVLQQCDIERHGNEEPIKLARGVEEMASIRRDIGIEAPAERVWDAIRDVGAVHTRLARHFVRDCRLDGDSRVVTFANDEVVRERIVHVDNEARRLAYAVADWRTTHHNASFQVLPDGETRCRLVWITDLLPDSLADLVAGFVDQGCVAIKSTLEQTRSLRPDSEQ